MKTEELVRVLSPEKPITEADLQKIETKLKLKLPPSMKALYLACNGGSTESDDTGIDLLLQLDDRTVPVEKLFAFCHAGRHTAERLTQTARKTGSIGADELLFAMTADDNSRLGCCTLTGAVVRRRTGAWSSEHGCYLLDAAEPLCASFDEFLDRLCVRRGKQTDDEEAAPTRRGALRLSQGAQPLTKAAWNAFERKLQVKLPAAMRNLYLKYNGGLPDFDTFTPQDEAYDDIAIAEFLPIKYTDGKTQTIEERLRFERADKRLPDHLLPFAIDGGDNPLLLDTRSKAVCYLAADLWDYDAPTDENLAEHLVKASRSFNHLITHLFSEEED